MNLYEMALKFIEEQKQEPDTIYENVSSECIETVEYDYDTRNLVLYFQDGSIYQYLLVPQDIAQHLIDGGSVGEYFNDSIRKQFVTIKLG